MTPSSSQPGLERFLDGTDAPREVISRATPHLTQAMVHIDAGEWPSAAASLRYVLDLLPGNREVAGLLALTEEAANAGIEAGRKEAVKRYVHQLLGITVGPEPESALPTEAYSIARTFEADTPDNSGISLWDGSDLPEVIPVDFLSMARWAFLDPAGMHAARAAYGDASLKRGGAQLGLTLMWLPVTVGAIFAGLGYLLLLDSALPMIYPAAIIILATATAFIAGFDLAPEMSVLAGSALLVTSLLLYPLGGIMTVLLFLVAVTSAMGVLPALAISMPGGIVKRYASGASIIVAVLVVTTVYIPLQAVITRFFIAILSAGGSPESLIRLIAWLASAVVLGGILMLAFLPLFGLFLLAGYLSTFFLSALLETNYENATGTGGIISLIVIGLTLAAFSLSGALMLWSLLRG